MFVVIGGGEVGIETAEFLGAQGKKVTLVEILPVIGELMVRDVIDLCNRSARSA